MKTQKNNNRIDMVTACGHAVSYLQPELTTIDPEDIKIHTWNICRYNGALDLKLFQHLALCVELASIRTHTHRKSYGLPIYKTKQDPEYIIAKIIAALAASHDFHEIYVTDVVSGLKKYIQDYNNIEIQWMERVHNGLGLPMEVIDRRPIEHIDRRALVIEMTMLKHPAAELVQNRYGGPVTEDEETAWNNIYHPNNTDPDYKLSLWRKIWRAFEQGRNLYLTHQKGFDVEIL